MYVCMVPRCVTKLNRGRGWSKLVKNSVTNFVDPGVIWAACSLWAAPFTAEYTREGPIMKERAASKECPLDMIYGYTRWGYLPAQPHEECVVGFCAVFDASEQSHRSVLHHGLIEFHHVQVLHCYPTEDRSTRQKHLYSATL